MFSMFRCPEHQSNCSPVFYCSTRLLGWCCIVTGGYPDQSEISIRSLDSYWPIRMAGCEQLDILHIMYTHYYSRRRKQWWSTLVARLTLFTRNHHYLSYSIINHVFCTETHTCYYHFHHFLWHILLANIYHSRRNDHWFYMISLMSVWVCEVRGYVNVELISGCRVLISQWVMKTPEHWGVRVFVTFLLLKQTTLAKTGVSRGCLYSYQHHSHMNTRPQ